MSFIQILPENVSNRIAAGEVIERPASVVKELLENSIDAGATEITVFIENAGVKHISISDNGCGMDADDALLCFEQHATSKIHSVEDISQVLTMGFRGEAMPSIASVARVRLKSRRSDSLEGNEVIVEGGKFISQTPAGCAVGTQISIRDLFFNTPARKKFLRSGKTEEKHIIEMVTQQALARQDISFSLRIDSSEVLASRGGNSLLPRLQDIFGKAYRNAMLPLDYEGSGIKISGYIAKHGYTKTSRKEQRAYINKRPVESPEIYRGIRNGYESLVMKGCFPPTVIFLEIAPDRVDCNVHHRET